MSSRILEPGTPIEPLPWRASLSASSAAALSALAETPESEPGINEGGPHSHPPSEIKVDHHHNPADEGRIRELEGTIKLLERRLDDERRASREQGHREGVAEGTQAGIQQEAAKWTEAIAQLGRSIEEMSKAKARFRSEIEEDAVKLALAIARKILNRELSIDPEALVGLARVALGKLNIRELQRVRIHPADAPAIEKMLAASSGPKRIEVIGDSTLERGGALFETDRGTLDASVTTQLSEIERGLADMLGSPSQ